MTAGIEEESSVGEPALVHGTGLDHDRAPTRPRWRGGDGVDRLARTLG